MLSSGWHYRARDSQKMRRAKTQDTPRYCRGSQGVRSNFVCNSMRCSTHVLHPMCRATTCWWAAAWGACTAILTPSCDLKTFYNTRSSCPVRQGYNLLVDVTFGGGRTAMLTVCCSLCVPKHTFIFCHFTGVRPAGGGRPGAGAPQRQHLPAAGGPHWLRGQG